MTFVPNVGLWGVEHFIETGSHLPQDPYKQNVVDGHVSLIPQVEKTVSYVQGWTPISGWHFENGLHSRTAITGSMYVSGAAWGGTASGMPSGSQTPVFAAGAWKIETPKIQGTPEFYSGGCTEVVYTDSHAPDLWWHSNFSGGQQPITIELDLAAVSNRYSGNPLPGFATGQHTGVSLAPLTGILGHGIYLNDGVNWDFLEVSPYGIRSLNHPEIALPIDLNKPKRVRIGLQNSDIYLLGENGQAVVGLGKFDADVEPSGLTGKIFAIGAPPTGIGVTDDKWLPTTTQLAGFEGTTYWDNIKALTGELRMVVPSGLTQIYPTGVQTLWSAEFDPKIPIARWLSADIGFRSYKGGQTTVYPQFSGFSGWQNMTAGGTAISGVNNPITIDISDIPVFNAVSGQLGEIGSSLTASGFNPQNIIRFQIDQVSTGGYTPSPSIDFIKVIADNNNPYLDLIPNWKPMNQSTRVKIGIKTGQHRTIPPEADIYTVFLFNSPGTGNMPATGSFIEESRNRFTGIIEGSGEYVQSGPFGNAFQTYSISSGQAYSGWTGEAHLAFNEGFNLFGTEWQSNFFPNPTFSLPFAPVTTLSGFVTGLVKGQVGAYLQLPPAFNEAPLSGAGEASTGSTSGEGYITLTKLPVYRPASQAAVKTTASYLGFKGTSPQDYVQNVVTRDVHLDKAVGIEAIIPSGMLSGKNSEITSVLVSCDIQIVQGTGVQAYVTGAATSRTDGFLPGSDFADYRRYAIPAAVTDTGRAFFGLTAPHGPAITEFNVDNISVSPYYSGYLSGAQCSGELSQIGNIGQSYITKHPTPIIAGTYVRGHLCLDAYPTGDNILFRKEIEYEMTGLSISINTGGFMEAEVALTGHYALGRRKALAATGEGFYTLTGNKRIPIGKWVSFGFAHQCYQYSFFGYAAYTGTATPISWASCNRGILTLDGAPIASQDFQAHWTGDVILEDPEGGANTPWTTATPTPSYIPDVTGGIVIGSGLFCKLDGIEYARPPNCDAETELSIKGARDAGPHFLPDWFAKAGTLHGLTPYQRGAASLSTTATMNSLHTLAGPGRTNWDHGPAHNHLLFHGDVLKEDNGPYPDLGCTRFGTGAFAEIPYCSALEKHIYHTGKSKLGISGVYNFGNVFGGGVYNISFNGWTKPYSTGDLFELVEDRLNPDATGLVIGFTGEGITGHGSGYFTFGHRTANNEYNWHMTSTGLYGTGQWHQIFATAQIGTGYSLGLALPLLLTYLFVDGVQEGHIPLNVADTTLRDDFYYQGASGCEYSSIGYYGRGGDFAMCDWAISHPVNLSVGIVDGLFVDTGILSDLASTGFRKFGDYNVIRKDDELLTGSDTAFVGYYQAEITLPTGSVPGEYYITAGTQGALTADATLADGFTLYDITPFKDALTYSLRYDDRELIEAFGDTISPIRVGYVVPDGAVNLARISSPGMSVEASINTISLADQNPYNLSAYRGGEYSILSDDTSEGLITGSVVTGSYLGINSGEVTYEGTERVILADIEFSGQVTTPNFKLTSLSVADIDLHEPSELYYYYLLGRGEWGVQIPDAFPHNTGDVFKYTTGSVVDSYISNIQRVKNTITLKNTAGKDITMEEYPWDILTSPFTPDDLSQAVFSGRDIKIDGVGFTGGGGTTGQYDSTLPDGVFSVMLLTRHKVIDQKPEESVWAHYPAYNFTTKSTDNAHSEVVNPLVVMRENLDHEIPSIGRYRLDLDPVDHRSYSVTVYGIDSGFTGSFAV